jgi:hypothetical protein
MLCAPITTAERNSMSRFIPSDAYRRRHRPISLAGPGPEPAPLAPAWQAPLAPIALTDSQMATVIRASMPLPAADHRPFFEAVAAALQGMEVGDGVVARACAACQRRLLSPPVFEEEEAVTSI